MLKGAAREAAAEFLGTFVLIVFGTGVVAQVVLSGSSHGGSLSISLGWALAASAQLAGALAGAALTFLTYRQAFERFDGGICQVSGAQATTGIFATYP